MKKYINILLTALVLGFGSVLTADAQSNRDFRPDFDYYDEEFDWRWDVRVRISDGINSGLITRWEANRLYRKLENIEEKEYAYLADGFFEPWEQDEIWRDVQWLNSRVGLELRDFDRTYYGFNPIGIAFTGYPSWWYNGGYNFYRFDRRGFGSIRIGYAPRFFVPVWVPNRVVYVNNYRNYGHNYYRNNNRNQVVRYDNRGVSNRNVTRGSRTNSGRNNGTVYNRNNNNTRRGTAVTSNGRSRSSSVNRSASTNRSSTARTRTSSGRSESLNRTNGVNSRSRETNRPTTRTNSATSSRSRSVAPSSSSRSREISRPSTSSRRSVAPSRSSAGRSESLNRSSRSSSSRSTVNRSSSRPSSSRSSSVSRSSSNRTKAPTASRSTSSRSRSSSSATRSSRREN